MSKKDYQAIARAMHETVVAYVDIPEGGDYGRGSSYHEGAQDAVQHIQTLLANVLASDNPRFDRARFIEACETGKCRGMRQ